MPIHLMATLRNTIWRRWFPYLLAYEFSGKAERECRQHMGSFQINRFDGTATIGTLSQRSRIVFAPSLRCPHILTHRLSRFRASRRVGVWDGGVIIHHFS
ncbi:hypothetical protein EDB83DRAFT_2380362 [Lactarius deliciosus]|nr:hypothetical protein EDB83DRAFT_2380362 [Lactarius deliciosus]